jgi:hypothetical protein
MKAWRNGRVIFYFPIFVIVFFWSIHEAYAVPKFMTLPFKDPNIKLKQGWLYDFQRNLCPDNPYCHYGIDYGKVDESGNWLTFEVVAVADGKALYVPEDSADGSPSWGNYVKTTHVVEGTTYYTINAHLKSSPLIPNQIADVERGQTIGTVGESGDANGLVHLHFEVNDRDQNRVDPYDIRNNKTFYPPHGSCGSSYLWTECPPVPFTGREIFNPLSFHKEEGDPTIYQFRTDNSVERLWPVFIGEVLFALTGINDFSMVEEHPVGTLDRFTRGPTIGHVGTLYREEDDERVWVITEAKEHPPNPNALGEKRHISSAAFTSANFKWENVLVLEQGQTFLDKYTAGPPLETEGLTLFIGLFENGNYNIAFEEAYKQFSSADVDTLGLPFGNGSSIAVHPVISGEDTIWIQDFRRLQQPHFGDDGETALMLNPQGNVAYLVKEGFWEHYKLNNGFHSLGAPLSNEKFTNGVVIQDFENGRLQWDGTPPVMVLPPQFHIAGGVGGEPLDQAEQGTISTIAQGLARPNGVSVDNARNVYIANTEAHQVLKVDTAGNVSTVAGDGIRGPTGDGGPATNARLAWPTTVAIDGAGNLYILDNASGQVRKIDTSGIISTVTDNLGGPAGVAADGPGNVYIADTRNQRSVEKRCQVPFFFYSFMYTTCI